MRVFSQWYLFSELGNVPGIIIHFINNLKWQGR